MTSADLTRSALQSDGTYVDSTVKGIINNGGSNLAGLPVGTYAKYAHTLFTATILDEADRITDAANNLYDVHHIEQYHDLDNVEHKQCELVKISPFTLHTLTLGSADSTTGLYAVSYAESSIYGVISPSGKATISLPVGYYGKYDFVFVTASTVYEGDRIKDAGDVEYEVKQVQPYPSSRTDFVFNWSVCGCIKRDFATQPATSGTWHVDSESVKTDSRNRQKVLIDTYLTAANIKKDDGTTNATTHTCFDGITYPITRIFLTKAVDALAVISRGQTNTLYTAGEFGHKPYGFEEQVKIEIFAINKSGITGSNLVEKFEQEIRRIYTTYDAYTNVRDIDTIQPETTDLGYCYLYKTTVSIKYKRNNDDFSPTYPTITWGPSATPTGTYTFPNCTALKITAPTSNVRLEAAERMGNITEKFGLPDLQIDIECDLDVEPSAKTWKRPQASTPKTDIPKWQVFGDIQFNGSLTEAYQTLNLGYGGSIPVTLEDFYTETSDNKTTLHLQFLGYNSTSATAYKTWFGINP